MAGSWGHPLMRPAADSCSALQESCMKSCCLTIPLEDAPRRQLELMPFERLRRRALPFGEIAGWLSEDDVFTPIS